MEFENNEMDILKSLAGAIEAKLDKGIVVITNVTENSINFVAKSNPALKDEINIGLLIKDLAKIVDGNGGGSPIFAQGGGTGVENLNMLDNYVRSQIVEE